jgi:transcriptional regulator with XRE-family HTH domain
MKKRCECGSELKPTKLREFDFSPYVGFPITLRNVAGLRCSQCKEATLDGGMINYVLNLVAYQLAQLPFRLSGSFATFLRKRLGLTQVVLADRMGIDRITIANWERGEATISPQHDFILRAMLITHFIDWELIPRRIRLELGSVRRDPPQDKLPDYAIAKINELARSDKPRNSNYSALAVAS